MLRNLAPLALLTSIACVSVPDSPVRSAPTRQSGGETAEAIALQMRGQMRLHAPSSHHKSLEGMVGKWNVIVESISDFDQPPTQQALGRARIRWEAGGRFLRWDVDLMIANIQHPVRGFLGYDVLRNEYQALWVSPLNTGMNIIRGQGDPEKEGISLGAGGRARSVLRYLDAESFVIEQSGLDLAGREGIVQRTLYVLRPGQD